MMGLARGEGSAVSWKSRGAGKWEKGLEKNGNKIIRKGMQGR